LDVHALLKLLVFAFLAYVLAGVITALLKPVLLPLSVFLALVVLLKML
jgi:hypothetical protein